MIWQDASHAGNACQQLELQDQEEHIDIETKCYKSINAMKNHENGLENSAAYQDGLVHEQKFGNNSLHSLGDDSPLKITDWEDEVEVTYRVDESPPFGFCILLGFQVEF